MTCAWSLPVVWPFQRPNANARIWRGAHDKFNTNTGPVVVLNVNRRVDYSGLATNIAAWGG